ncbi:hypothetical protein psal_cds_572 [Pandoravirus salinus]|uniref:Uncharacterized protein n=1 Tax=Pandoravirus salinus TaxID=1349410 RepID=A0A291ATI0_9VIRU|nr:hypothetical protein psal_cds_572 [Pandoravirus salinus]ATE82193.1 hypothetical protein psal_cds_572 [Pandoravirus salinus]
MGATSLGTDKNDSVANGSCDLASVMGQLRATAFATEGTRSMRPENDTFPSPLVSVFAVVAQKYGCRILTTPKSRVDGAPRRATLGDENPEENESCSKKKDRQGSVDDL